MFTQKLLKTSKLKNDFIRCHSLFLNLIQFGKKTILGLIFAICLLLYFNFRLNYSYENKIFLYISLSSISILYDNIRHLCC